MMAVYRRFSCSSLFRVGREDCGEFIASTDATRCGLNVIRPEELIDSLAVVNRAQRSSYFLVWILLKQCVLEAMLKTFVFILLSEYGILVKTICFRRFCQQVQYNESG